MRTAVTRWRWRHYIASPERLFFAAAALVLATASVWWAWVQLTAPRGDMSVPPVVLHAVVMVFGVFPLFFAGFLFGPGLKWLKSPAPTALSLAPAAAAHVAGVLVLGFVNIAESRWWFGVGMLAIVVAWGLLWIRLLRSIRSGQPSHRTHYRLFAQACAAGLLGACGVMVAGSAGQWAACLVLAKAGVWIFVGLTFIAAAHRMIPFVSGTPFPRLDERFPTLVLKTLTLLLWGRALQEVFPVLSRAIAPAELLAGAALLGFAVRWARVQSLRPKLLRMLFTGFIWLGLTFVLSGLAGAMGLAIGPAVLHAFTIGFIGTTMLAMLSRFASARVGPANVADRTLWALFLLLQCAAIARVFGPGLFAALGVGPEIVLGAASVSWMLVWVPWLLRYGHMLGRQ